MPKKSTFTGITSVPSTYFFDVFGQGFNYRISKSNLFQQITDELGASGVQSINALSGGLQLIAGTNMSIAINSVDGTFTFDIDSSQTFASYALNTTDATGITQGFSGGGNSVFAWSWDGTNTSASINHNSVPYVSVGVNGVSLADVNFAAFGGTEIPQPVLSSGSTSELISALGTTSGLSWLDDSTNGPFDGISGQLFCFSGAFDGAPLVGARLSFGANESTADSGIVVPRNCQFVMATLMATGIDGTLTLALEIDQVAQSAAHDLSVTGTVTDESDIVDVASAPLAVSAGQQVNYEVTTAPTTAGAINVVLWFVFD